MIARKTLVYFIATSDRSMVKIGCSNNPPGRLSTIMTWSPLPLEILAAVPGNQNDERATHARYSGLHSHREWFRSSPEMLSDIAAIAQAGSLPEKFRGKPGQKSGIRQLPGIKATPEWRAKMSKLHKARCARLKSQRAAVDKLEPFLKEHRFTADKFNELFGTKIIGRRFNDDHYICGGITDARRVERFIKQFAKEAA